MDTPRCVIVTGGTYGIGRAITVALAAAGHQVVAFGLESAQEGSAARDGIEGTRRVLSGRGLAADLFEADVSRPDDVRQVVRHCVERYGGVHGLVNNAAVRPTGAILSTSVEAWNHALAVNLTGPFLMIKEVGPHMLRAGGGSIVNVSSAAGWGRPDLAAYSASKGGLFALSAACGYDLRAGNVRVNTVVPGAVPSGMTEEMARQGEQAAMSMAALRKLPLHGADPEDVGEAVAFLMSDGAAAITGAVLNVGGFAQQGGPGPRPISTPTPGASS